MTNISIPNDDNVLFVHAELEKSIHNLISWKQRAWRQFSIKMIDRDFPCLFSKRAWSSKTIYFLFCDKYEDDGHTDFLKGMLQYSEYVNHTELKKRLFSPLVVFFSPDFCMKKTQHEVGWEALKWLHSHDVKPWPSNIPKDPESAEWTFCFNNIEFFINMSTKDHRILRNRNLGSYLTFVINARENFDTVANGQTQSGRSTRKQIRERVRTYNGGVVPSELGFYGEAENLEWKQYQLSEPDLTRPNKCPFISENHSGNKKLPLKG